MDMLDPVDALALRFYDAAADPGLFAPLIRDIGAHIGCTGGTFMVWDNISGGFIFKAIDGMAQENAQLYDQYYGAIDPLHALMATRPTGTVVRCHEHFDDAFVSRNEAYVNFHVPIGGRYMASTRLTPDRGLSAYLSFGRTARMGPFDDGATAVIKRLIPHASRAAKLSQRMAQLQQTSYHAEKALDYVDWGILILDGNGRLHTANAAALALLREGDGLFVAHGQLTAASSADQARLGALIHTTSVARRNGATDAGGALAIERRSGRRPLNLLAVPLPRSLADSLYARAELVMVTITDPERNPSTPAAVLISLFGLSIREAEVALALAAGLSVAQIADAHQRSQETIRGQVKAVMVKTGSNRQADLVRVVLSLPRLGSGEHSTE